MKRKFWFRFIVVAAGLLLAASWGVSQALHEGWGRRFLLARLSASFGRPVEAGRFTFSLLNGPSLEADAVTVAEDPQFGEEYFLRADQLTATLHWSALVRGRIEFGTLSLSHPSLNLVRAADGRWNFESWLPPEPSRILQPAAERRLSHIVVDDGRINFKLGAEKLLLALTNVSGHVDHDGSGRWDLDVQADPLRASVALQESGTLRLRGTVAGTSARLRPASLMLTWEDASLADALRLAGGQDYGVRGMLGAELSARIEDPLEGPAATQPDAAPDRLLPDRLLKGAAPNLGSSNTTPSQWSIATKFHLAGIHRWDLPARDDDPGLNLTFTAAWRPGSAEVAIEHGLLETTHSQLRAVAEASWSHGFKPSVRVLGSRISLDDALQWTRAFRRAVPDGFSGEGALELQAVLQGWPPRIGQVHVAGAGAALHLPGLVGPIRVGPVSVSLRDDLLVLEPLSVSLPAAATPSRARAGSARMASASPEPAAAGVLHVEGSLGPMPAGKSPADWPYRLAVSGRTTRAQDLLTAAEVLRDAVAPVSNVPGGSAEDWKVQGPVALQLAWLGTPRHMVFSPSGTLNLNGLQVMSPVLNRPLLVSSAEVDLRPGERHVTLADLEGLGTSWNGTLDWNAAEGIWHFDLAADHLDAAELDRWMGPGARPGFFARIFPFIDDNDAADRHAAIERLAAHGQLHVAELGLASLELQKIEASVELKGRNLALRHAQAEFFDGRVLGDFAAQFTPDPAYSFHGRLDRVNLGEWTASANWPGGRLGGLASGDVQLAAHGLGRASLIASLSAQGDFHVRAPVLRGFSLSAPDQLSGSPAAGDSRIPGETRFRAAEASIHMSDGVVHIDGLSLARRDDSLEAQGSVDLARHLDLRLWSLPRGAQPVADSDPAPEKITERIDDPTPRMAEPAPQSERGERAPQKDRQEWSIGGTLDAPLVTRQSSLSGDLPVSTPVPAAISSPAPASPTSSSFLRR